VNSITTSLSVLGNLPTIIKNKEDFYLGDLKFYFKKIWNNAQNLQNGYHNFRHMFHIVFLCYEACKFYQESMSKREMRNLLIAAMFHDVDHPGTKGNDDLNIERAVRFLKGCILPIDQQYLPNIVALINATEYPYSDKRSIGTLTLSEHIIRDADMGQALAMAWLQQVVFGLAKEWNLHQTQVLRMQPDFLSNLKFVTQWAKRTFSQAQIIEKFHEANELLSILDEED